MSTSTTIRGSALGATALWVSIEGINGVGKTSAARAVAAVLGARCLLLDELTDSGDTLTGRVIAALSAEGDPFLRTGSPVVETLALLALEVRKAERLATRDLTGVGVILEDRGVDSVAVCQAAILCSQHPESSPDAVARHVLSSARRWTVLPDATIVLTGDPWVCARRFADRTGCSLTPADVQVLEQIDILYRAAAVRDPGRFTLLDTAGMSPEETAAAVQEAVTTLLHRQATHAS
ncbi:thymidylate kinase [Frankia sp. ACN1ag]|uniref:thymidylate kinase n=1 Tax=Frankia sp. ACN1ag TaxID=102891 RepID=UPI0006DD2C07|nr:thymidylate kinase [Frankia sp. ACN1ag]KQC37879.1 thymidylate kinase [Frankia sp. ACN1ag]